jgi:hypothetical protein
MVTREPRDSPGVLGLIAEEDLAGRMKFWREIAQ